MKRAKKFIVLYDSKCAFCVRAWQNIKKLDHKQMLAGKSLYRWHKNPGLKLADLKKEIHIITPEGRVKRGADGFLAIWPHLRKIGWLSHLTRIPGTRLFADFIYRSIAEHRTFLSRFLK
ncbi:MAG: DUF393 domain-containing protein [Deltaproteobacteria bacterium]|nr:DUF393 domain-containing protein [Deltaproteobacteria bacterium]